MRRFAFSCRLLVIAALGATLTAMRAPHALGQSAGSPWTAIDEGEIVIPSGVSARIWSKPTGFYVLRLEDLKATLAGAPLEYTPAARTRETVVALPRPDGAPERFRVVESPVLSDELAALYPEIHTYSAQGLDDPSATARVDVTALGFHAMVLSPRGNWMIDPYQRDDTEHYVSHWGGDLPPGSEPFECLVEDLGEAREGGPVLPPDAAPSGATLRTYRTAISASAEYTAAAGGAALAANAITSTINRVTGFYEREVTIRLSIVGMLTWVNPATDPYTNPATLNGVTLGQNQAALDAAPPVGIGAANYDIGHFFTVGAGNSGAANVGVVCVNGMKGRGGSSCSNPAVGDVFDLRVVAHEMGHQFSAGHSFNSRAPGTPCAGQRMPASAVEPGSGSTTMAYAGLCFPDDVQPTNDYYFHTISFDEITNYREAGGACRPANPTGNNPPTIAAVPNYVVPRSTPFELTGNGNDLDGDAITYCWEQTDLGPPAAGPGPLFRSFLPTANRMRSFPNLQDLLDGAPTPWEALPAADGTVLNFRCTVRDNRAGGGGVDYTAMTVTANGAPFRVIRPNGGEVFRKNSTMQVTWLVGGSAVLAGRVDIYISYDDGATFELLLGNTPNDGVQPVFLGATTTASARLKIKGRDHIFFDVSDDGFAITGTPNLVVGANSGQVEFATAPLGAPRAGGPVFGNGAIIANGQVLIGPGANFPDLGAFGNATTPGVRAISPNPYVASRTGPAPFGQAGAYYGAFGGPSGGGIIWGQTTRCVELFPPNPDVRATVNVMRGTATFTNVGPEVHCRPGYAWGTTGFIPTGGYGAIALEGAVSDPVTGNPIPIQPVVMAFDGFGSLVSNGTDFASGSLMSGFTLTPAPGGFSLRAYAASVGPIVRWPNGSASTAQITVTMIADPGLDMTYDASLIPNDSTLIDFGGAAHGEYATGVPVVLPAAEFALSMPSPNPTRGATYVELSLPRSALVRVSVFDAQGREVAMLGERLYAAGRHTVAWNAQDGAAPAAPGVYFLVARGPEVNLVQRVVLVR